MFGGASKLILRFKMSFLIDLMSVIECVYRNVQSCRLHCVKLLYPDQKSNCTSINELKLLKPLSPYSLPVTNCPHQKPINSHIKTISQVLHKALSKSSPMRSAKWEQKL